MTEHECRAFLRFARGLPLEALMARVGPWLRSQAGKVAEAYLTWHDGGLRLLVVQERSDYDRDLVDALTELDLAVAQAPDLQDFRFSVLEWPSSSPDSVAQWLDERFTLNVFRVKLLMPFQNQVQGGVLEKVVPECVETAITDAEIALEYALCETL